MKERVQIIHGVYVPNRTISILFLNKHCSIKGSNIKLCTRELQLNNSLGIGRNNVHSNAK